MDDNFNDEKLPLAGQQSTLPEGQKFVSRQSKNKLSLPIFALILPFFPFTLLIFEGNVLAFLLFPLTTLTGLILGIISLYKSIKRKNKTETIISSIALLISVVMLIHIFLMIFSVENIIDNIFNISFYFP